jgi:ABC-2 type transport system permease protein
MLLWQFLHFFTGFFLAGFLFIVVLLFISPLMTMRIFAEERKNGADELLLTAPVTSTEIVLGKFLALAVLFAILESLLLIHLGLVCFFVIPEFGPIFSALLGLLFMGMLFVSVGLFASSLSDNQIICALAGFGLLMVWWLVDWLGSMLSGKLGDIIGDLSFIKYYHDFSRGVIDTANIIFYLSITAVFILSTIWRVESRRWR